MLRTPWAQYWRIQRDSFDLRVFYILPLEIKKILKRANILRDLDKYAGKSQWKGGKTLEDDVTSQVFLTKIHRVPKCPYNYWGWFWYWAEWHLCSKHYREHFRWFLNSLGSNHPRESKHGHSPRAWWRRFPFQKHSNKHWLNNNK